MRDAVPSLLRMRTLAAVTATGWLQIGWHESALLADAMCWQLQGSVPAVPVPAACGVSGCQRPKMLACAQGMDTYSNILYVKEQFAALSHLAHRAAVADKYRPETCCIIGNYYSLKGQHEKVRRRRGRAALLGLSSAASSASGSSSQQRRALWQAAIVTRLRQIHAATEQEAPSRGRRDALMQRCTCKRIVMGVGISQMPIHAWKATAHRAAVQAVLYFRRALKLNRHYLSAWTLMGHEYVEMKNPPAAIGAAPCSRTWHACQAATQTSGCCACFRSWCAAGLTVQATGVWCAQPGPRLHAHATPQVPRLCLLNAAAVPPAEAYRRAVDLNPRDYRAWYGLGQTYELLHMPFYALHYFRRATQARACARVTAAGARSCSAALLRSAAPWCACDTRALPGLPPCLRNIVCTRCLLVVSFLVGVCVPPGPACEPIGDQAWVLVVNAQEGAADGWAPGAAAAARRAHVVRDGAVLRERGAGLGRGRRALLPPRAPLRRSRGRAAPRACLRARACLHGRVVSRTRP